MNNTIENNQLNRTKRAATARPERVWDYAVIPYKIDANFSGVLKALFKQASFYFYYWLHISISIIFLLLTLKN